MTPNVVLLLHNSRTRMGQNGDLSHKMNVMIEHMIGVPTSLTMYDMGLVWQNHTRINQDIQEE